MIKAKTTLVIKLPKTAITNPDGTIVVERQTTMSDRDLEQIDPMARANHIGMLGVQQAISSMIVNQKTEWEVVEKTTQKETVAKPSAKTEKPKTAVAKPTKKEPTVKAPKAKAASLPPAPKSKPKAKARPAASA